ncbi:hypothetical protein [Hyphomonas sp.]|uniref:hypothetical protein n=1 Tax=Hyphomonas sp. TaxID=87 RepID=UPI0025BB604A|nr:hypothetical protein [Hyphomonas sp.]MBI1400724.1 hypothetical protein [Hyphomonas sp.]
MKRFFANEQLLFLRSEDLSDNPHRVLEVVCGFLGLACHDFDVSGRPNAAPNVQALPDPDRRFLRRLFRNDAVETQALLGWERNVWGP